MNNGFKGLLTAATARLDEPTLLTAVHELALAFMERRELVEEGEAARILRAVDPDVRPSSEELRDSDRAKWISVLEEVSVARLAARIETRRADARALLGELRASEPRPVEVESMTVGEIVRPIARRMFLAHGRDEAALASDVVSFVEGTAEIMSRRHVHSISDVQEVLVEWFESSPGSGWVSHFDLRQESWLPTRGTKFILLVEVPSYPLRELHAPEPKVVGRLAQIGVKDTRLLLHAVSDRYMRNKFALFAGLSEQSLLFLAGQADLLRVSGIGPEYAALLKVSGIDTVRELRLRNPAHLAERLEEANAKLAIVHRVPGVGVLTKWIDAARRLSSTIRYR